MANVQDQKDEMSVEERLNWLRERGVQVVTPEERRAGQVADALRAAENLSLGSEISFVLVPADPSKAMQELYATCPNDWKGGDFLLEHLKPFFEQKAGNENVDLTLLSSRQPESTTQLLASGNSDQLQVSDQALLQVARQANIETFALVHPSQHNHFTGINVYLDEIGMLKRLPSNTRVMDYAKRAGYDPAPQFYGDVFLARILRRNHTTIHSSFLLGPDTDLNAPWLLAAAQNNLQYQLDINRITGNTTQQPNPPGTDGKDKEERGYSWSQTEEELEIVLEIPEHGIPSTKQIQVKFRTQSIHVQYNNTETLLQLRLFEKINLDGCTWTMDKTAKPPKLVMTMEKVEQALWPRVHD